MSKSLFSILFTSFFFASCSFLEAGSNEILKEVSNPAHSRKAILFIKGGNATVDNSLQVSVVDADYDLMKTEVGNTFTADSDHGMAIESDQSINMVWISDDTLQIVYNKALKTFEKKIVVDGINIVYLER